MKRIPQYNATEVGQRIRTYREKKGYSQAELARKADVSRQCVYDYEIGKFLPKLETAQKICEILDLTTEYLYTGKEKEPSEKKELMRGILLFLESGRFQVQDEGEELIFRTRDEEMIGLYRYVEKAYSFYGKVSAETYGNLIKELFERLNH